MNRARRLMAEHCAECPDAPSLAREEARRVLSPKRSVLKPKKDRPRAVKKRAKKEARRERIFRIREAVRERAGGRCEAATLGFDTDLGVEVWRRCRNPGAILDHWLGGSGRRQTFESVETTWLLCVDDNDKRTANDPTAAHWNEVFEGHCGRHGYAFTPHIVHSLEPTT